jgi:hypothetical protein
MSKIQEFSLTAVSLLFLLVACVPAGGLEPVLEESTAVPTPTSALDFSGVHIRLHNAANQDFDRVELTIGEETMQVSPLTVGDTSAMQTFTAVPHPPTIRATIGDAVYEWLADPSTGNNLIAGGEYTFELTLENEELAVMILMENPILQDAQYYAADLGIPLPEAVTRLETQQRLEEQITTLNASLEANESDTFAGLWLQHEPTYAVVVAFSENGEETIARYVTDDSELAQLIEVRQMQYTYTQLQTDLQTANRILQQANFLVSSGINVMGNQVELYITDQAAFDAALAKTGESLPDSVVVITTYEPVGENPPFDITPMPDVFMPQLKIRDSAFMEALLIGQLVVEDGCLRVKSDYSNYLVIWQADYFLTEQDGRTQILDETGEVVAEVGQQVYMGGGEMPSVNESELRQPIPAACGGPYWRMGNFLPEEYIPNVTGQE